MKSETKKIKLYVWAIHLWRFEFQNEKTNPLSTEF